MSTDIKEALSAEALRIVTGARRSAYGKPEQNFQRIADFWMTYFKAKGWILTEQDQLDADMTDRAAALARELQPLDVAAMMRLMKEARLTETPDHYDSYLDLVGYTLCGAEVAGVVSPFVVEPEKPTVTINKTASLGKSTDVWRNGPIFEQETGKAYTLLDGVLSEGASAPKPKFKAGDRARVIDDSGSSKYSRGEEGIVTGVSPGTYSPEDALIHIENRCAGMFARRFELVSEAPKPFQIEAGKFYADGHGAKVGPMMWKSPGTFCWVANSKGGAEGDEYGRLFANDGTSYTADRDIRRSIVADWPDAA